MLVRVLLEKLEKKKAGVPLRFLPVDAVRLLWALRSATESRGGLAKRLGVGEGSVRTILSFLVQEGLVETSREGCFLSKKGGRFLQDFSLRISCGALPASAISFGLPAFAARVRKVLPEGNGQMGRDLAVRLGAQGATIFCFEKGGFRIPFEGGKNFFEAKVSQQLRALFYPVQEQDFFAVCFGEDCVAVERAAFSIALDAVS